MEDAYRMKGIVEEAVRDALGRAGLVLRDVELFVDWDHAGVILRRKTVGHETAGDKGLGDAYPIKAKVGSGTTRARATAIATRFVERMLALQERERTIARHAPDATGAPPWSVLVDPCALHLIHHAGWHPREILEFYRPQAGHYTVGPMGYTIGSSLPGGPIGDYRIGKPQFALNGGVLNLVRLTVNGPGARIAYQGGRINRLEIGDTVLPQTLLAALRRRTVGDAVGHPSLEGCTARITSASQRKGDDGVGDLHINLAHDLHPLEPAPDGVDTGWMEAIQRG